MTLSNHVRLASVKSKVKQIPLDNDIENTILPVLSTKDTF